MKNYIFIVFTVVLLLVAGDFALPREKAEPAEVESLKASLFHADERSGVLTPDPKAVTTISDLEKLGTDQSLQVLADYLSTGPDRRLKADCLCALGRNGTKRAVKLIEQWERSCDQSARNHEPFQFGLKYDNAVDHFVHVKWTFGVERNNVE